MLDAKKFGCNKADCDLLYLGVDPPSGGPIGHLDQWVEFDELVGIMDSGAVDSVAPPSIAPSVEITPSVGSRAGLTYNTAGGTKIANLGEKIVMGLTEGEQPISMTYQMAEVTRPLCSVGKICDGQKLVVFGPRGDISRTAGQAPSTTSIVKEASTR